MRTAWDLLQDLRAAPPAQFTSSQLMLFADLHVIRRLWTPEERRRVIGAWHAMHGLPQPEPLPAPLEFNLAPAIPLVCKGRLRDDGVTHHRRLQTSA